MRVTQQSIKEEMRMTTEPIVCPMCASEEIDEVHEAAGDQYYKCASCGHLWRVGPMPEETG